MRVSAQGHDAKETGMNRIRRSIHFVPGGNDKMFGKALGLPADALILDLEDSVPPARKLQVREEVRGWLESVNFGNQQRLVRINPLDSEWCIPDLEAVIPLRPDAIVLPKVFDERTVASIDACILNIEKQAGLESRAVKLLLIGTEDASAVFNLHNMANHPRVDGFTWGAEDLSVSLGARAKRDAEGNYLDVFRYVRSMSLIAAVAANVQPIDAVYVEIRNTAGLRKECTDAANMGFTGKLTVHPDQIEIVNRAFTPTAEEIAHAAELVEAFARHEQEGRMAFSFHGAMVDVPHLKRAQRVLEIARQLAGRNLQE